MIILWRSKIRFFRSCLSSRICKYLLNKRWKMLRRKAISNRLKWLKHLKALSYLVWRRCVRRLISKIYYLKPNVVSSYILLHTSFIHIIPKVFTFVLVFFPRSSKKVRSKSQTKKGDKNNQEFHPFRLNGQFTTDAKCQQKIRF